MSDERDDEGAVRRPDAVPARAALIPENVRSLRGNVGNAALSRLLSGPARLHRQPEIGATDIALGQKVVDDLLKVNRSRDFEKNPEEALKGVFYPHTYAGLAKSKNPYAAAIWNEDCRQGYANSMFERQSKMNWKVRAGSSAAIALKTWLNGPTIAECASVLVAIELDAIRAAVGDERFDELFSDQSGKLALRGRLTITQFKTTSSLNGFIDTADASSPQERVGYRSVKKGGWYYFFNHPKYLLKHPDGVFQGENSVCMNATPGAQTYSGFGVGIKTEPEMLDVMAGAYNNPRSARDFEVLVRDWAPDAAAAKTDREEWAEVYARIERKQVPVQYWQGSGWPDKVNAQAILDEPELEVKNVTRKGGLVLTDGEKRLNADAVRQARGVAQTVQ